MMNDASFEVDCVRCKILIEQVARSLLLGEQDSCLTPAKIFRRKSDSKKKKKRKNRGKRRKKQSKPKIFFENSGVTLKTLDGVVGCCLFPIFTTYALLPKLPSVK